ncbi:hypothetical protein ACIRPT_24810 [Streptomyces sp. NPDC101227]|uniref:hypothetical protein n=1 Tax=Streptomyces sp. NPDC101227 TaxID=3366136 RepID=UPI00380AD5C6
MARTPRWRARDEPRRKVIATVPTLAAPPRMVRDSDAIGPGAERTAAAALRAPGLRGPVRDAAAATVRGT